MKNNLLKELEELKNAGNIEETEKKIIEIEKISADIKLTELQN